MLTHWILLQASEAWHREGLYMGMHWIWWLFWIAVLLVIIWAFWRLRADRAERHREAVEKERAEEVLRARFARGEIDERELAGRMRVLQETRRPRVLSR